MYKENNNHKRRYEKQKYKRRHEMQKIYTERNDQTKDEAEKIIMKSRTTRKKSIWI